MSISLLANILGGKGDVVLVRGWPPRGHWPMAVVPRGHGRGAVTRSFLNAGGVAPRRLLE